MKVHSTHPHIAPVIDIVTGEHQITPIEKRWQSDWLTRVTSRMDAIGPLFNAAMHIRHALNGKELPAIDTSIAMKARRGRVTIIAGTVAAGTALFGGTALELSGNVAGQAIENYADSAISVSPAPYQQYPRVDRGDSLSEAYQTDDASFIEVGPMINGQRNTIHCEFSNEMPEFGYVVGSGTGWGAAAETIGVNDTNQTVNYDSGCRTSAIVYLQQLNGNDQRSLYAEDNLKVPSFVTITPYTD